MRLQKPLAINLATMTDSQFSDNSNHIRDLVNHAVITDSNLPIVLRSGEFAAAGWSRVFGKSAKGNGNAGWMPDARRFRSFPAARSTTT